MYVATANQSVSRWADCCIQPWLKCKFNVWDNSTKKFKWMFEISGLTFILEYFSTDYFLINGWINHLDYIPLHYGFVSLILKGIWFPSNFLSLIHQSKELVFHSIKLLCALMVWIEKPLLVFIQTKTLLLMFNRFT